MAVLTQPIDHYAPYVIAYSAYLAFLYAAFALCRFSRPFHTLIRRRRLPTFSGRALRFRTLRWGFHWPNSEAHRIPTHQPPRRLVAGFYYVGP